MSIPTRRRLFPINYHGCYLPPQPGSRESNKGGDYQVRGFKRFTDLKIEDIPQSATLVIMAGPNGCGKSSLFEALFTWHRLHWSGRGFPWERSYHEKQEAGRLAIGSHETVSVTFWDAEPNTVEAKQKAIYLRSAYRNDPKQLSKLGTMESALMRSGFTALAKTMPL